MASPRRTGIGRRSGYSYSNPLQMVREDYGNLRVDHDFSAKDALSGVYTVDDGIS